MQIDLFRSTPVFFFFLKFNGKFAYVISHLKQSRSATILSINWKSTKEKKKNTFSTVFRDNLCSPSTLFGKFYSFVGNYP